VHTHCPGPLCAKGNQVHRDKNTRTNHAANTLCMHTVHCKAHIMLCVRRLKCVSCTSGHYARITDARHASHEMSNCSSFLVHCNALVSKTRHNVRNTHLKPSQLVPKRCCKLQEYCQPEKTRMRCNIQYCSACAGLALWTT